MCCIAAHCASIVVAAIGATWARQAALSRVGPFLYERIFKHRCSYMVYSEAFQSLPPSVKKRVFARMRTALAGEDPEIDWLGSSERKKISAILEETLPDWKEG